MSDLPGTRSTKMGAVLLAVVLLAGCEIDGNQIVAGQAACAGHGGIRRVNSVLQFDGAWYSVVCADGTNIQGKVK